MRKKGMIGIFCVFQVLLLFSCGKEEENKEITKKESRKELKFFFYKQEIAEGMDALAAAFMGKNPGVVIENEMIGSEYNTILMTRNSAGRLPNVWAATPGERALKPFIDEGKIQPVNRLKVLKLLDDNFLSSVTFADGNIWVVPFLTTARGIIYNADLFEKAGVKKFPETLEEMETATRKLKDNGIVPFAGSWKDAWSVGSLVYQVGAEIFDTPDFPYRMSRGEASHSELKEIFGFIDLYRDNCQSNSMSTDYMGSISLYAQEKAAMLIQGPWAADPLGKLAPEVLKESRMKAIPYANIAEKNKLYIDYDCYWAVSSDTDMELLDRYFTFILDGEGKALFQKHIKALNPYGIGFETHPVNKSIFETIKQEKVIGDNQYVNAPSDGWWQIQGLLMQEYLVGKISQDEMLEKLDKEWVSAIEDRDE